MTRRDLLKSTVMVGAAARLPGFAAARRMDQSIRLVPMPTRIFKTPDASHERTESWVLWLLVETDEPRALRIQAAEIALSHDTHLVHASSYGADGVPALTIVPPFSPRLLDGRPSPTPIHWPQALRVRCTEPAAAKVDSMSVSLELAEGGNVVRSKVVLPVEVFVQKTSLLYPFKGKGVITQAGVTNGGHRNRSGQFALDGIGLDAGYGVNVPGGGRKSEDYAGWGRTLIAPAGGMIVRARADRPDQPDPENSDPKFYAPEYPNGGDPGNHLVIDHGNGEFSMLAHFQAGSMLVKVGDRVRQAEPLGKLGSSGDTNTPHSHYQLQSGPDWEWSDGLPCTFANLEAGPLVRGAFFDAK